MILKLSNQGTTWTGDQQLDGSNQTFRPFQQQVENLQVKLRSVLVCVSPVLKTVPSPSDADLQDDIEAYKTQNQFLNSEIYQLTRLWRTSSEQERSLITKVSAPGTCLTCPMVDAVPPSSAGCRPGGPNLPGGKPLPGGSAAAAGHQTSGFVSTGGSSEAGGGGSESGSPGEAPGDQVWPSRWAEEEALTCSEPPSCAFSDYDDYGFKMFPDYEVEDVKLLAKIQALEIRSHNLLQQVRGHVQAVQQSRAALEPTFSFQEGLDRPLLERWGNYLAARSDQDLRASPELKGLLRAGVPQEYRRRLWSWMVHIRTRTIREHDPDYYQQVL